MEASELNGVVLIAQINVQPALKQNLGTATQKLTAHLMLETGAEIGAQPPLVLPALPPKSIIVTQNRHAHQQAEIGAHQLIQKISKEQKYPDGAIAMSAHHVKPAI